MLKLLPTLSLAATLALALAVIPASAAPERFHEMARPRIAAALKKVHKRNKTLESRVEAVSELFLGTPYKLGPLGEGPDGEFDRDPLISFAAADCTTLIEQSMALALEPELDRAEAALQKIRYRGGKISYETRNHFPEADWVPQNAWAGYLKDVTAEIAGEKVKTASKRISKREWYAKKTAEELQGIPDPADRERRLARLKTLGESFEDQIASLPYLPMDLVPALLPKIPSGTIANLVREDQADKPVLIAHQVLLVRRDGSPFVRHAAFGGRVEDVPALEYFYRFYNSKWRLLGLNLNRAQAPR